ncbi:4-oxalocrotonate tautomerase [Thermoanaerobacter mathranii subsp. mathranii str. A3]|uniref:Phenylpyruvate tautomerase PptA (4-oxalocrotonate tautomerase family) n=2 Tax=Thermoanaerobacter TaxID=1754 RepID=A0ABT9M288_9THEO|nr:MULTISPECIES: phenylpyruvate tautomerase MIF-related protein [Thermoanaerobacter]ADH60481.1 4-oxalocrotonate tautomerase [Thermoanaerobacter mathranii subsp. mathranii str. A3]MBT1279473.1 tautomerase family protein [Thermoanaerobacter sp. CM-CNRG TB177]MDP9750055.1 phenylpyruvate tautomerase PptA (4-oxalocrotonate tautomerase family) [Thermoanaerobacter pentosaceus]
MPIVNLITKEKIVPENKEVLKKEFADVMYEVAGKSENWLMVRFTEEEDIFFHGQPLEEGGIVEIKLVGKLQRGQKEEISKRICDVLNKVLGYRKDNIYIVIQEVEGQNWGYNGVTF